MAKRAGLSRIGHPPPSSSAPETTAPARPVPSESAPPKLAGNQDPHALTGPRDNILEVAIGREVKAFRTKLGITVADLATATGLSHGMLSKIENGLTSPSLTTLQVLSRSLGVPMTAFFRRFEERRGAIFVKAGEGLSIERRGTRNKHQYHLLGYSGDTGSRIVVEPYMITLTTESDVFPLFQHAGLEFLYMLEGEVVYRHADKLYPMSPGDSLFFDADAPMAPKRCAGCPSASCPSSPTPRGRLRSGADQGMMSYAFRMMGPPWSRSGASVARARNLDPCGLRSLLHPTRSGFRTCAPPALVRNDGRCSS